MRLVLLDSLSLINRAFHALPLTLTDTKGRIINAVYGYINMLSRIIKELSPTHIAAAFDLKEPTFRHVMYSEYKGTRKPTAPELLSQIPIIKEILDAMNIKILEKAGYEADDIIGTTAKKFDMETIIVTGDKDALQLIDETTKVWLTNHKLKEITIYDIARLAEDGYTPCQIIELKALMGDASDNIPGIKGVGEETAKKLLAEYDSLDGVYANLDSIKGKLREKIEQSKDIAYLSRTLATIDTNVPLELNIDEMTLSPVFSAHVKELFAELRFKTMFDKFSFDEKKTETMISSQKLITKNEVVDEAALDNVIDDVLKAEMIALTIDDNRVSIAVEEQSNYEILIGDNFLAPFTSANIYSKLSRLFSAHTKLIVFSAKDLRHRLVDEKITAINCEFFDVSLASYVLDCTLINNSLEEIIDNYALNTSCPAASIFTLYLKFTNELSKDKELLALYNDMEMPLSKILFDMENVGFGVSREILTEMSEEFDKEINSLTEKIYADVGEKFNINSTKQMSEILYEKLHLPMIKKTKTGISSSADVLEMLRPYHPVIDSILRYRQLTKLNSTYCVGLIKLIDSQGKIHTTFKQNYTQTGRLSSTEPNLQNIPVRDEYGKLIRRAFVASPGNVLICADYSQIELRLLAHFSGDDSLLEAYRLNRDIHSFTASLVFNVPLEQVTSSMRRSAKAVNFGIVYGISDYGLSEQIGIPVYEAKEFIEKYFIAYPKVKTYMQDNVKYAKENGYIKTLFGRVRRIHEISSSNYHIRSFGERVAMNMPLQGSSSDIIKLAMINISARLEKEGLTAKMILQVHDELIIDTPLAEKDKVMALLAEEMEHVVELKVPLTVGIDSGHSWFDCK